LFFVPQLLDSSSIALDQRNSPSFLLVVLKNNYRVCWEYNFLR
jgi:hypothetical protein